MVMAASDSFHVLAVDDSLIDRKLIERLLKTSSYQVTTVDSGSKALEFLGLHEEDDACNPNHPCVSLNHNNQEVEVNLVITDYCMPGMTGYDLLKRIKESSSLRNIPVVIMSSENVPSRINRCLEEGAEEFFLKPVRLSDVNKLKPHMMKTKSKSHDEKPNKQESDQDLAETTTSSSSLSSSPETPSAAETAEFQSQQSSNNNMMNKRKAVEEGASPDRTRARYNSSNNSGLTVVSN